MFEVEVKLAIESPETIRKILVEHGFKLVDTCVELDMYVAHPCRDFATTDEALRFRKRTCSSGQQSYTVTYKGPRLRDEKGFKTREEVELVLTPDNWIILTSMFSKLGFTPVTSFSKKREVYANNGVCAYLDYLHGVGYFVELELLEGSRELVSAVFNALKPHSKLVEETYLEICLKTRRCLVVDST